METQPMFYRYRCEHCNKNYQDRRSVNETECPECGKAGITAGEWEKKIKSKPGKHETPLKVAGLCVIAGAVFFIGGCTYSFFTDPWSDFGVGSLFFFIAIIAWNMGSSR